MDGPDWPKIKMALLAHAPMVAFGEYVSARYAGGCTTAVESKCRVPSPAKAIDIVRGPLVSLTTRDKVESGFGGWYALTPGFGRTVGRISQYRAPAGTIPHTVMIKTAGRILAPARIGDPFFMSTLMLVCEICSARR
jgi:hypothetical protein